MNTQMTAADKTREITARLRAAEQALAEANAIADDAYRSLFNTGDVKKAEAMYGVIDRKLADLHAHLQGMRDNGDVTVQTGGGK